MTIASEIQRIKDNISDAYTSCQSKGATMPATQNSDNLSTCIDSISGGGATLITKSITQNGTYNASSDNADGYSSVTVNVQSGSVGIPREIVNGVYRIPKNTTSFSLPNNATSIGPDALAYACYGNTSLTSVDLSSITTLTEGGSLRHAFYGCSSLVNDVDLSNLTTISSIVGYTLTYAFNGCYNLTSIDLSSLTTIQGTSALSNTFNGCSRLASIDFSGLKTIGFTSANSDNLQFGNCFYNCTNLTSITFPSLETIYCTGTLATQGTFYYNNKIQKLYFPKLNTIDSRTTNKTACKNIFYGCSSLTELHFGAANRSAIEATAGYSTAWGRGAGNVTIYFDL